MLLSDSTGISINFDNGLQNAENVDFVNMSKKWRENNHTTVDMKLIKISKTRHS